MSGDAAYHRPDQNKLQLLNDIANKLRIHSIESTNASKSGYAAVAIVTIFVLCNLFSTLIYYISVFFQTSNIMRFYG